MKSPRFAAFHARVWSGQDCGDGALLTFHPTDGKPLNDSASVRVFHAFAPAALTWRKHSYEIKREEVILRGNLKVGLWL